jgi:hypothetical protein
MIPGFTKNLTEQEIKEGVPVRKKYREKVIQDKEHVTSKNTESVFETLELSKQLKEIVNFIDKELAWLNANVEVKAIDIQIRQTKYDEELQTKIDEIGKESLEAIKKVPSDKQKDIIKNYPFEDKKSKKNVAEGFFNPQELQAVVKEEQAKKQEEEEKKELDEANKTVGDGLSDALKTVMRWILGILYIFLCLRAASLIANDLIWRPVPYRILGFIYAFVFGPIITLYYLIFRDTPKIYAFFPLKMYEAEIDNEKTEKDIEIAKSQGRKSLTFYKPLSVIDNLFGFQKTADVLNCIQSNYENWVQKQLSVLR